ncbi:hypothetical protein [Flaviflexus ciconiae]|uniref:hypothetical protein n=1 Tax=Flaviflexus ciconiae TaxID=2496867 RepID=UPI0013E071CE|nr:hypothetical protein [Flaviflexus ciconiae]
MKPAIIYATLTLVAAALWATHLPSPNPINGSFIGMCAALGMLGHSLMNVEVTK